MMINKKTLYILALATLLTTACVPVVLVGAGATAGATLARDGRTLQAMNDDTNIEFEANQKIKSAKLTDTDTHITVTSYNYVVLLTGEVPSDAVRAKAESMVQNIPKVRRVYNMLQVTPVIGALQLTDDATIYTNIRARMLVTSNLNASDFKWVVENKVVFLMGYADKAETQTAIDVIRNSAGVSRVINLVQIPDEFHLPPQSQSPAANVTVSSPSSSSSPVTGTSSNSPPAPLASPPPSTTAPAQNGVNTGAVPEPAQISPTA